MTSRSRMAAAVLSLAALSLPRSSRADWPANPLVNLPICTAANQQTIPQVATDMAGGAFITWQDFRSGVDSDIYAQRVLASGVADPGWAVNGRAVCAIAASQFVPRIVSDAAGGAIIAWGDRRNGSTSDIYAHHLLQNGTVDPVWPANGLPVCTAGGDQNTIAMVADAAGGAIVAWLDFRTDTTLYAQHVLAGGLVDGAWPVDGRSMGGRAANHQTFPMVSDGKGGAIVAWSDSRVSPVPDVYAQCVRVGGAIAAGWPADGVALCTAADRQQIATMASDGAGGAIVAWEDQRSGTTTDIYAQHVKSNGAVDAAWPADGRAVCAAAGNQTRPQILRDGGSGSGAIVAWRDTRAGSVPNLYAQHVLASGVLDPTWPAGDLAFCTASGDQFNLSLVSDGMGGALGVWDDARGGTLDIFAQHLLATGAVDPAWPVDRRGASTESHQQNAASVIPDGSGGFIAAWTDGRPGAGINDVYAQRVQANGQLGGTVVGVPRRSGAGLALKPPYPNPWHGGSLALGFSLESEGPALLEIMDGGGRVVAKRDAGRFGSGAHEVRLEDLPAFSPGLYFVVLRAETNRGRATRTTPLVVLR